ncbi:uncharacterized protein VP01_8560g1 [Puccinia sorghi]|uniref:Uncharacterized protein n=1 Tax=Puccinia sorghi TaxID=27349 RepID=A0A0L6U8Z9_9BASI|nr:uncharacterized protein VP01_8560g1 [Puccinia sorghi]
MSSFLGIKLDDPLWNNGHFYHVQAPWSIAPLVQRGISLVLTLDQVEEEYRILIRGALLCIELAAIDVGNIDPEGKFAVLLPTFPLRSKLKD